jgi:uncharacterized protein YjiS (DUF1127 family)
MALGNRTSFTVIPWASSARPSVAARCIRQIAIWINRARQRRALAELDDHMLNDIGVSRSVARREAGRPFWDSRPFWDY